MLSDYELRKLAKYTAKELGPSIQPPDEWLDIPAAAKMLGCTVSTLQSNTANIPHHKPFRRIVFSRRELEAYIKSR